MKIASLGSVFLLLSLVAVDASSSSSSSGSSFVVGSDFRQFDLPSGSGSSSEDVVVPSNPYDSHRPPQPHHQRPQPHNQRPQPHHQPPQPHHQPHRKHRDDHKPRHGHNGRKPHHGHDDHKPHSHSVSGSDDGDITPVGISSLDGSVDGSAGSAIDADSSLSGSQPVPLGVSSGSDSSFDGDVPVFESGSGSVNDDKPLGFIPCDDLSKSGSVDGDVSVPESPSGSGSSNDKPLGFIPCDDLSKSGSVDEDVSVPTSISGSQQDKPLGFIPCDDLSQSGSFPATSVDSSRGSVDGSGSIADVDEVPYQYIWSSDDSNDGSAAANTPVAPEGSGSVAVENHPFIVFSSGSGSGHHSEIYTGPGPVDSSADDMKIITDGSDESDFGSRPFFDYGSGPADIDHEIHGSAPGSFHGFRPDFSRSGSSSFDRHDSASGSGSDIEYISPEDIVVPVETPTTSATVSDAQQNEIWSKKSLRSGSNDPSDLGVAYSTTSAAESSGNSALMPFAVGGCAFFALAVAAAAFIWAKKKRAVTCEPEDGDEYQDQLVTPSQVSVHAL